jgi:hypothetical protein
MLKKFLASQNSTFDFQFKFSADDKASDDRFGTCVVLSADGNTAIIGADGEDTNPTTTNGAAYVFVRSGNSWSFQQKLLPSDLVSNSVFGFSVSISHDGNTAIIGAVGSQSERVPGAAYVFVRAGSVWTEQQKLISNEIAESTGNFYGEFFGVGVNLSADGNTAIVGAFQVYQDGQDGGAAYVFVRSGNSWSLQQKFTPTAPSNNKARFGVGVALSADGNTAIVGANGEIRTDGLDRTGSFYIFNRSGTIWTQTARIIPSAAVNGSRVGTAVALSTNGNTALIGSDANAAIKASVYIYTNNQGTWSQQARIEDPDGAYNQFGYAVSLSGDGNTAIVGALQWLNQQGKVWIFTKGITITTWTRNQFLIGKASRDQFGFSVDISRDSNTILIGARLEDTDSLTNNGTAYVYTT